MPVLFLLDPELEKDLSMGGVGNITLSYTFFKTGEEPDGYAEEAEKQKHAHNRVSS